MCHHDINTFSALAKGRGINRVINGPSPQGMHREIVQFLGNKMGKHELETEYFLVKGA